MSSAASQTHQAAIANLGASHLLACGLLLGVVVATSAYLRLGLAGRIVLSAARCAGQLLLLCGFILEPLFQRNSPPLVVGYLALIVALAAREASARLKYGYDGVGRDFFCAFCVGAGSVIVYAAVFVLALDPLWDAK